jgi:hypothetical protein
MITELACQNSLGGLVMSMKQFFAIPLVLSWLWFLGVGILPQASAAVPERTSPQVGETQQFLPSDADTKSDGVSNETNQQQPLGVPRDTNTEHDQKLCESPEVVMASCEPIPGSPLSAFPLVLNTERPRSTTPA